MGSGASEAKSRSRPKGAARAAGARRRKETLARMRALVLQAAPGAAEEVKWRGTPVWSHHGIICTGEAYAKVVKLTVARGVRLADPSRLFNASLAGRTRRAIDLREGEQIEAGNFKAPMRRAVAENGARPRCARP